MNGPQEIGIILTESDLFHLYNAARKVAGESRRKMETLKDGMAKLRTSWKEHSGSTDDDFNAAIADYWL